MMNITVQMSGWYALFSYSIVAVLWIVLYRYEKVNRLSSDWFRMLLFAPITWPVMAMYAIVCFGRMWIYREPS